MKVKQYKKSKQTTKRNSKSVKTLKKIKSKAKGKILLVDKKMSFGEIINRYPQTAEILMANGMHCFGCSMAMYETLEQGAIMHGVNPDKLVEKINKTIGKKK
jgi:hybrid cluster-associated redox disulfide protein